MWSACEIDKVYEEWQKKKLKINKEITVIESPEKGNWTTGKT